MDTAQRIRTLITRDFGIAADRLTDDVRLEDLGVDSIGVAELIFNVEDEFALKLPDLPQQLATFGDVVAYIDAAIDAQRAGVTAAAGAAAGPVVDPVVDPGTPPR